MCFSFLFVPFQVFFNHLSNRDNRQLRIVIFNLGVVFLLISGVYMMVHSGPFEDQMKKYGVISGYSISALVTFFVGIVLGISRIFLEQYVIVGNFFLISSACAKYWNYFGVVVFTFLGYVFSDWCPAPISRQLLYAFFCIVLTTFLIKMLLIPVHTDLGLLDSMISWLMVFMYRDFKNLKKWEDVLIIVTCTLLLVLKASYEFYLIRRSERADTDLESQNAMDVLETRLRASESELEDVTERMNRYKNQLVVQQSRITQLENQLRGYQPETCSTSEAGHRLRWSPRESGRLNRRASTLDFPGLL
ncbi:hypothetical protein P3S67_008715 [Capsicum chacoense]|uniref:uncharacterized protein LOC107874549 n=1 Tax=Capsicum annuum TaxID=4072 RepID=UPI0007BED04E|nr:uncharacterized protein LOC107874549 [Capsicum annuum]